MAPRTAPGKQRAVLFPRQQRVMRSLGENIRLARKRRGLTQLLVAERAGMDPKTLRGIEQGDPGISIGHYVRALGTLSLDDDLVQVARDDELGRKLQDIETLGRRS